MSSDGGSAALEQFVILAKTTTKGSTAALIQQVLSNRKIFVFGELMAMPSLQALRGTEHEPWLRVLEIFAYGTYRTYHENRASLPKLSEAQLHKLRQLTLVSLAHQHESVPYALLFEELGLQGSGGDGDGSGSDGVGSGSKVRELEDLVIETIYMGLLSGRLDQRRGLLRVKGAIGRDVRMEDVPAMAAKLQQWAASAEALIANFEDRIADIRQERQAVEAQRAEFKAEFERVKAQPNLTRLAAAALAAAHQGQGGGGGVGGGFDAFDEEMEGMGFPGGRKFSGGRFKQARRSTRDRGARK